MYEGRQAGLVQPHLLSQEKQGAHSDVGVRSDALLQPKEVNSARQSRLQNDQAGTRSLIFGILESGGLVISVRVVPVWCWGLKPRVS